MEWRNFFSIILVCQCFFVPSAVWADTSQTTGQAIRYVCSDWPPFEFVAADGRPAGFSIEILQAMHKEMGLETGDIEIYPWSRAYQIGLNKPNTLLFTIARSPEREALFKWVGPIAPRKIYLWKLNARTDIQVSDFEDVKRYLVGTVRDTFGEKELINKGFELGKNYSPSEDHARTLRLLYNNRVDFIYGEEIHIFYGLQREGLAPSTLERSLLLSNGLSYYYAFHKDTPDEIVARFNSALKTLKNNGVFASLARRYGVASLHPD